MKLTEFWFKAHCDERNEPSGPRLGGFLLAMVMILVVFAALYAAFSGQKLAAETGVKLVAGLGTVVGVLYGASQLKGGLVGIFGTKATLDGMPGQVPTSPLTQTLVSSQPPIVPVVSAQPSQEKVRHTLGKARQALQQAQHKEDAKAKTPPCFLLRGQPLQSAMQSLQPLAASHVGEEKP